jgi:transmembrane sensor
VKSHSQDNSKIAEEAARWLVRLEEDHGPQCRAALAAWLKHSPRHVEEFLLVEASYSKLDGIDARQRFDVAALLAQSTAEVIPLHETEERSFASTARRWSSSRWRRPLLIGGLAASLAALVLLLVSYQGGKTYETGIGEQRSVRLEDGSIVHMNTRSRISVSFSQHKRDVQLLDGEALFVVAHDVERPFRVAAGTAMVQAVGTQFDVYRRKGATTIAVVEGRVKVSTPPANKLVEVLGNDQAAAHAPTLLAAGEEAQVTSGSIVKRASDDHANPVAWRQRQMVFRADTLADVVEQMNRYNRTQIRIADPSIAQRRLSGTFEVDDLQSLLTFLSGDGDLTLDYDLAAGWITIRSNPRDASAVSSQPLTTAN